MPDFFLVKDIHDVITHAKFGDDRLRGLGVGAGQISAFPIDFAGRPYNTLTLPCERVILMTVTWCYVIIEWWGADVVICLERGADLHIAQVMPLPLAVSCSSKIQIGLTFLVPAYLGSPGQRTVKRVCALYNLLP